MKAKAAILFEVGKKLDIREVDVRSPQAGEVMIKMAGRLSFMHSLPKAASVSYSGPSCTPSRAKGPWVFWTSRPQWIAQSLHPARLTQMVSFIVVPVVFSAMGVHCAVRQLSKGRFPILS